VRGCFHGLRGRCNVCPVDRDAVVRRLTVALALALALAFALTLTLSLALTLALALSLALTLTLTLTLALTLSLALTLAILCEGGAETADASDAENDGDDIPRRASAQAMHLAPFFPLDWRKLEPIRGFATGQGDASTWGPTFGGIHGVPDGYSITCALPRPLKSRFASPLMVSLP
jgi:hypothetical protein